MENSFKKIKVLLIFIFLLTIKGISQIDYIKILQIDTTFYDPEGFFVKLEEHYAPLGEIEEMSCILGNKYYDVEKIYIRFKDNPIRWVVYTPEQAEAKLKK